MKNIWCDYKVVFIYLFFGCIWILFSDLTVLILTDNPKTITTWQTFKGWGFVGITAFLLFLLIRSDVIRKKKYLYALNISKQKAEKAAEVKSTFMNNLSHEVRTPMNAIIGFSELLRDEDLSPEKQKRYIEGVQQSCFQLVDLITNIVDASELHVEQSELIKSSFCLNDLLDELAQDGEGMLMNFNNTDTKIRTTKPLARNESYFIADYGKLSRALYHLIQNAIKYTAEGFIDIGYEIADETNVKIYIKDTGKGIHEQDKNSLFKAYAKSKDQIKISHGVGLGLNIVKGFVDLMKGDIQVHSKLGEGTVVYMHLPLERDRSRNSKSST